MLKKKKIAIIGGGKMGSIIAQGLLSRKTISGKDLTVTDVDADRRKWLSSELGLQTSGENRATVMNADIVILAVKPQNMAQTLQEIAPAIDKSKLPVTVGPFAIINSIR